VPDSSVCLGKDPLDDNGDVAKYTGLLQIGRSRFFPDQSQTKVTGNILHCLKHGSRLGWLIDPDERSVWVYPPGQQPELLQEPGDYTVPDQ